MLALVLFLTVLQQIGLCRFVVVAADKVSDEQPLYHPVVNAEYDAQILDPLHGYGSPYGGFSRAVSQRLAALPLHLPEIMSNNDDDDDDEAPQQPGDDPLYTTIRDGTTGQLFACRVYHEDELAPESLNDSMFDPPILVKDAPPPSTTTTTTTNSQVNKGTAEKSQASSSDSQKTESSSAGAKTDKTATQEGAAATATATAAGKKATDTKRVPPNQAQQAFILVRMTQKLEKIRGMCAQIHKGWWSYEWCYEGTISQFHVAVVKDAGIEIQDITSLGRFKRRDWTIDVQGFEPNPLAGNLNEIARVTDTHDGGTVCPDTNQPRRSVVNIVCCTDEIMAAKKALLRKGDTPVGKSNDLALYDIEEDPEKICHYTVTICTPILCEKPEATAASSSPVASATDDGEEDEVEVVEEEKTDRTRHKHDESIMEILDRTLGGRKPVCLQSITGGWWTFEFCHGKSIRQYHEVVGTRRDKNGAAQTARVVETDHNLGRPQTSLFRSIVPQDEWQYVVNATDKNGAKKPYFELEYTNGDICDDHDVRDAAIVAGNQGAKGLARSSSVRYACGETYDIVVNEDSTCHYVVNIAVPDLCRHPIFKTPVSKKQVFKCLAIDEPDVDESTLF